MKIAYVYFFLLLFFSCSVREKSLSLLLYNENDPYVALFSDQLESFAKDRFELSSFDSKNSQLFQNELIVNEINRDQKLLIINPVDRLAVYAVIRKLKESQTPVIFFNREPLAEDLLLWDKAFYVGAKAQQSGQIQAEMIMELFGNNPQRLNDHDKNGNGIIETVILKGEQGHQDAEIRTSEVLKTFADSHFILKLLITEVANWKREIAYEKMKEITGNYGQSIELIISNNDAMALGALSYLRQNGFFKDDNNNGKIDKNDSSWIPIVGIDGLKEAQDMIDQGYLYGSVLNDSRNQAKAIVELSSAILKGGDFSEMEFDLDDGKYIWIDYQKLQ